MSFFHGYLNCLLIFLIHCYMKGEGTSTLNRHNSNSDHERITSEHRLFPFSRLRMSPRWHCCRCHHQECRLSWWTFVSVATGSRVWTAQEVWHHITGGTAICRCWAMSSRELVVQVCFLCLPITGSEWGWTEVNAVINPPLAAFPCKINLHPLCWIINRLEILRPCTCKLIWTY